jgi:hypothetical protein
MDADRSANSHYESKDCCYHDLSNAGPHTNAILP